MLRSNILAHRGCWDNFSQKNNMVSLAHAVQEGFGVETDVRDYNGQLVISHDPPSTGNILYLETFLDLLGSLKIQNRIGLNIKSDGLAPILVKVLMQKSHLLYNIFAFDMSIPESVAYKRMRLPFYSRTSEYETESNIFSTSKGVWVDNFTGNFDQVLNSMKILSQGKRACIVSPELHGRSYLDTWKEIKKAKLHMHAKFELCTDYPDEAFEYFCEEK